jgi:hypothetical protein
MELRHRGAGADQGEELVPHARHVARPEREDEVARPDDVDQPIGELVA